MGQQNFSTPKSLTRMELLADLLVLKQAASAYDLAPLVGVTPNTVCDYLRHMQEQGSAVRLLPSSCGKGGANPAIWGPGQDAVTETDAVDDMERKVVVLKQWPPNHTRMVIDCYLFGFPAVLEAA